MAPSSHIALQAFRCLSSLLRILRLALLHVSYSWVGVYVHCTCWDLLKLDTKNSVYQRRAKQKAQHDQHARFRYFYVGQSVMAWNFCPGSNWISGVIAQQLRSETYMVDVWWPGVETPHWPLEGVSACLCPGVRYWHRSAFNLSFWVTAASWAWLTMTQICRRLVSWLTRPPLQIQPHRVLQVLVQIQRQLLLILSLILVGIHLDNISHLCDLVMHKLGEGRM